MTALGRCTKGYFSTRSSFVIISFVVDLAKSELAKSRLGWKLNHKL